MVIYAVVACKTKSVKECETKVLLIPYTRLSKTLGDIDNTFRLSCTYSFLFSGIYNICFGDE